MPTVPVHQKELILRTENNHIPPAPQAAKEAALPDVRMQLADAVRQETKTHGSLSVEFMDRLASSYLTPQAADTPAGWDYAALRRSAQEQSQQIARQQQTHSLNQQAAWMEQVATATSDSASLKAYLTLQLPAYKKQLLQEGIPEEQADKTVEGIRSSSVQKHISRSLSGADWQTAQEVLAEQGDALPAAVRQQYAQQIRCQFSREVARQLWQASAAEPAASPQETAQIAFKNIQEPDEQLHDYIRQEITRLSQAKQRQQASRQADLFDQLSQADEEQLQHALDTQTVLPAEGLSRARRAAATAGESASKGQQAWFVKNYFTASSTEIENAFEKGQCSARDYFRLKAVQQRRESGAQSVGEQWLCRGIENWMRKQGFNEKDISQVSYAVLTGAADTAGRAQIWGNIKTLLDC